MNFLSHLTDMQFAIGLIALAIGGILVIWYCCRLPLGPKPQPREDFTPLFPAEEPPATKSFGELPRPVRKAR